MGIIQVFVIEGFDCINALSFFVRCFHTFFNYADLSNGLKRQRKVGIKFHQKALAGFSSPSSGYSAAAAARD